MPPQAHSLPVRACPTPDTLLAFNGGTLPEEDLEGVALHLAECPSCESRISELQQREQADPLVQRLRRCLGQSTPIDEQGFLDLEARARAIGHSPGYTTEFAERKTTPRQPVASPLPTRIGNYRILGCINQGGMGVVYRAVQEPVERVVALKMIVAGAQADPQLRSRFRVEGQAVARLRHPHVIQIFDFGEHDDLPFFSMELMEGGSLSARLRKGTLEIKDAARLVAKVARAMQFAHEHEVLHRDLKPGNILLSAEGEPKVSDFGLAKLLDAESDHTRSEMVLGTPGYMAPEQLLGKRGKIGPAVDIYALGAVLYECLTGQPPFKGENKVHTLELVRLAEPVPPSRMRKEVPADLEAICLKCLEKKPGDRYRMAKEVAEDLERFRAGEPTVARPPGWLRKSWRFAKRHQWAAAVGVLVATVAGLAAYYDPDRPRRRAESQFEQGSVATLLGETGKPPWFRIRHGEDCSQVSQFEDGTFTVHTTKVCLVEMLPKVSKKNFRFSAKIRHHQGEPSSRVGLYFAHGIFPGPVSGIQQFTSLDFTDRSSAVATWEKIPFAKKPPRPKGNSVAIAHTVTTWQKPFLDCSCQGNLLQGACFVPGFLSATKNTDMPWRVLEIRVLDHECHGYWNGDPVGTMDAAMFENAATQSLAVLGKNLGDPSLVAAVPSTFCSTGGIGLYVTRGVATFSSVHIEPLGGGE